MNKLFLAGTALIINILSSCATKDTKNEVENYPNYDTTRKTENLNVAHNDSSYNGAGDMRQNIEK